MKNLASRLRDRVVIRRLIDSPDGLGGFNRNWHTVASVYAEVKSQSGREALITGALQGVSVYRVAIRYRADIRTGDQILYRGQELNIRSVSDREGRRIELDILADTEAPQRADTTDGSDGPA